MIQAHAPALKTQDAEKMVSLSNILVATDFSPVSQRALDYALALARRTDGRIYLTHIITPDAYQFVPPEIATTTYANVRQAAEQGMGDILVSGRLRGVPHEVLLEEGPFWPTLKALIEKHEVDLVVAGTHGIGGVQKILIGSVAEQIFRQAVCPVLTVGPSVRGETPREVGFKKILFATDLEPTAQRTAAYALSLAQEHQAELTLMHVIERASDYSEYGMALQKEMITHEIENLVPAGASQWCRPDIAVGFGHAAEQIVEFAREHQVDLIVMGAKPGRKLVGHMPRATAYKVVCGAPCPVMTIVAPRKS